MFQEMSSIILLFAGLEKNNEGSVVNVNMFKKGGFSITEYPALEYRNL
ncbi:MAG: hypothetical protein GX213_03750 [Clostridiaceae bacterium]|nr:hypothetical protein [Clostridiaceae bacterium]